MTLLVLPDVNGARMALGFQSDEIHSINHRLVMTKSHPARRVGTATDAFADAIKNDQARLHACDRFSSFFINEC